VLNVGLNDTTIKGLIAQTKDARFAYDAYRRLVMMYADVVMEKAEGIEPKGGKGIRKVLDERLEEVKKRKGYKNDTDLTAEELKALVVEFKKTVKTILGKPFPDDPQDQIWGGIGAVFMSRVPPYRKDPR
jgi:pyruvate,orthophosphate dikinase